MESVTNEGETRKEEKHCQPSPKISSLNNVSLPFPLPKWVFHLFLPRLMIWTFHAEKKASSAPGWRPHKEFREREGEKISSTDKDICVENSEIHDVGTPSRRGRRGKSRKQSSSEAGGKEKSLTAEMRFSGETKLLSEEDGCGAEEEEGEGKNNSRKMFLEVMLSFSFSFLAVVFSSSSSSFLINR